MRLTFLGTGTSQGIPIIGCDCDVCRSEDPRDRRLRSSIHVEHAGFHLQVDAPPEFRLQALAAQLTAVDAVLITHTHADHIFGLDDLRQFNALRGGAAIPVYAAPPDVAHLRKVFAYMFKPAEPGTTRPRIELRAVEAPFALGPFRVTPLPVWHGAEMILGYRLDADGCAVAYAPDCSGIPDETMRLLEKLDVMVLDALRPTPHPTHLSLPESLALLRRIGARRSFITHLCHRLGHAATQRAVPGDVTVPWDGLTIEV